MKYNTTELNELIKNRRSVFSSQFNGQAIDKQIIEQILENANWAPTHNLTEPWRFKVYSGNSLQQLMNDVAEIYKKTTPPEKVNDAKIKKFQTTPQKVSHAIAICMKRDPKESIPEIEEVAAVSCAVQNMALTAAAYNLGAYWGTPELVFTPEMKEYMKLGEKDVFMGFLYLGISDAPTREGKRKPIAEKVEWYE